MNKDQNHYLPSGILCHPDGTFTGPDGALIDTRPFITVDTLNQGFQAILLEWTTILAAWRLLACGTIWPTREQAESDAREWAKDEGVRLTLS